MPDLPFQRHSGTSIAAAGEMEECTTTLRGQIYRYLARCLSNGATDDEIQVALNMNPSTQRPRRIELWDRGLVRDSGQRRKTRAGRNAAVWVVTQKAIES